MIVNKTLLSVVDNVGIRRAANVLVGEDSTEYTSGDILDANATKELIDNASSSGLTEEQLAVLNFMTAGAVYDTETGLRIDPDTNFDSKVYVLGDLVSYGDFGLSGNIKYTDPGRVSTIHIHEPGTNNEKVTITGDIAVNKDNNGNIIYDNGVLSVKSSSQNVISWIRENSNLYWMSFDFAEGCVKVMKREVIGGNNDGVYNTFMKLPQFWYKCVNTSDGCDISFTHDYTIIDDSWNEWDGDTFIGCYKASISGSLNPTTKTQVTSGYKNYKLCSHTGLPHTNFSWTQGRVMARNCGDGFSLVTYDAHKIMEILFYAYYGEVDAQAVCGAGASVSNSSWSSTNLSNGRVMNTVSTIDTKASDNPTNNNFWGLCDWWGNVDELIDDVELINPKNNVAILDYDGNAARIIRNIPSANGILGTKKLWGKSADIFYVDCTDDYNNYSDAGYTVLCVVHSGWYCTMNRSCVSNDSRGGVGWLSIFTNKSSTHSQKGSRLQYHGPWIEVDDINV